MKIPSVHITKDKKIKMNKILGGKGMKIGIRKPSIKKTISARNPMSQVKKKYSIKKFSDPLGTIDKRMYNKLYNKTTVSIKDVGRISNAKITKDLYEYNKGMNESEIKEFMEETARIIDNHRKEINRYEMINNEIRNEIKEYEKEINLLIYKLENGEITSEDAIRVEELSNMINQKKILAKEINKEIEIKRKEVEQRTEQTQQIRQQIEQQKINEAEIFANIIILFISIPFLILFLILFLWIFF